MSDLPRKTITQNGYTLTVQRRTVLSDARFHALATLMVDFYEALAAELNETPALLDRVLVNYAQTASQTIAHTGAESFLPTSADTLEVVQKKARAYLELPPDFVNAWQEAAREVNMPVDIATAPLPLSEDAPKNA